jgi:hypothetical protein
MAGKAQKSHGARSGLYGGRSNGVPPISVSRMWSGIVLKVVSSS